MNWDWLKKPFDLIDNFLSSVKPTKKTLGLIGKTLGIILATITILVLAAIALYLTTTTILKTFVYLQKLDAGMPVWLQWTVLVLSILLPIGGFLFIRWRKKIIKNPPDPNRESWLTKTWKKVWKPLVGLGLTHLVLAVFFRDTWGYKEYILNWWTVFAQVAIALAYLFLREEKVERGKKETALTGFGNAVIWAALAGLVFNLWIDPWLNPPPNTEDLKVTSGRPSPTDCPEIGNLGPIPGPNAEGEKKAREFWSKHAKKEDLESMMKIIERESNFNHLESDGSQALVGRINCNDRGLHQINLTSWYKEVAIYPDREVVGFGKTVKIKDINPEAEEGNFLAALYLYNQTGLQAWKASTEATAPVVAKETLIITAPTGGRWSETIEVNGRNFSSDRLGQEITQIEINGDQVIELDPKKAGRAKIRDKQIKTLRYRSMTEKEEKYKIEFY